MTGIADRIGGRVKQLNAEIINDGRLAEEGAQQIKNAENAPPAKPFGNLDKLT
ncbi:hypothetical protein ACVIHH_005191 [Bradyrhizobium sp. USDA 4518]|uniref:hypothetical protein n=1 Tax=unclassified Bradyrhizobium TaxID=2631580 RepID=UPI0020A197AC|nr:MULTISPECIES: hypothetical protein [unclassified Bradyrhizobium]MCP1848845.1 hypothetical protein [Bradyrhizobium sp. USDA 4541]MCP1912832.1 hypothetical protein [Bradyrhizobium elkanii]